MPKNGGPKAAVVGLPMTVNQSSYELTSEQCKTPS